MAGFVPQNNRKGAFSAEHARAPYRTYHKSDEYITDYGLISLPVARKHTPGKASARIVRLHAPATYRVVVEVVERLGDWPELPKAAPRPKKGEALAERRVKRFDPVLDENGHDRLYRVEIMYVFLCTIATEESDSLPGGVVPFDEASGQELPAAAFTDRLAAK